MLKLLPTKAAVKFLSDLPMKPFRQVMGKVFSLMENPYSNDSKQLKGCSYRRADVGEYRIIYRAEEGCLIVARIGKRNDAEVYRNLTK